MKKYLLLFSFILFAFTSNAKEVTTENAVNTATKILSIRTGKSYQSENATIKSIKENGKTVYFIIQFNPEGWALISADDAVTPVLGYSPNGHFPTEDLPDQVNTWLGSYKSQILSAAKLKNAKRHFGWIETENSPVTRAASDKVNPILTVKWNQNQPYNQFCPIDPKGPGGHVYVGCVAVAMAQAMTGARYPVQPTGKQSYLSPLYGTISVDYDKEAPYNWSDILSGANSMYEAARLMYHCGVSVSMEYGADGSGALTSKVAGALRRNFGYPSTTQYLDRAKYPNNQEWENIIVKELKAGRVVVYAGAAEGANVGHCFNLDGYDGYGSYHVNWGWGGSANGYYPINGLKDDYANYTVGHQMVIGISEPYFGPTDIVISNMSVYEKMPVGTVVGDVSIISELKDAEYNFKLKGPYNVITETYAKPAFSIENGILKTVEALQYVKAKPYKTLFIKAINKTDRRLSLEKEFRINILQSGVGIEEENITKSLSLYPIPATDNINLSVLHYPGKYTITSVSGEIIDSGIIEEEVTSINLSSFSSGYYLFIYQTDEKVKTTPFIIKK